MLASLSSAADADTETPRSRGARLTWVRGASAARCVGKLGLEEDVKARLGYDPFGPTSPIEIAIEGAITRQANLFQAELVMQGSRGEILGTRVLTSHGPDCRSLGDAVAVAITVAIDPDASGVRADARTDENVTVTVPPAHDTAALGHENTDETRGRVTAQLGASIGLLPGVSPVVSLRARRALGPRWDLGVGGHFWPESQSEGVGFALATGSVDACLTPFGSVKPLRWCGGVHAGVFQVFVHAPALAPIEVGMFPWLAAETGPALSLPLVAPLRLDAGVSMVAPMLRRQALVRGLSGAIWEQSPLAGRIDVGVAADF